MLNNGFLGGSFNPLHNGHINEMILPALEYFETIHVFVRYNEGVDLVDWETKKEWFDQINVICKGKLIIHKLVLEIKDKSYGKISLHDFLKKREEDAGVRFDGIIYGNDHDDLAENILKDRPDFFIFAPKRVCGYSSTEIRKDIDEKKDWMPDFVYQSLKKKGF